MNYVRDFFRFLVVLIPWPLRRVILIKFWSYEIPRSARIGFSWVFPKRLKMGEHSRIGHLNVCKGFSLLQMGAFSIIGRNNWITGFPEGHPVHFSHEVGRVPKLVLGNHAAITNRHYIDCTSPVEIGEFSTFAGIDSKILTHSIHLKTSRQSSQAVSIGKYCFVGIECVFLGGSSLPDYSVLAAKSLLNKSHTVPWTLYGGGPAQAIKTLPKDWEYFSRKEGFVN